MDVLVPDRSSADGRAVAEALEAGGHRVHSCIADEAALPCAALVGRACPLDEAPVDIAVDAPHDRARSAVFGDGALCAVRRHIPLVLTENPATHPLAPWASAVTGADVRAGVAAVLEKPLAGHTGAAAKALLRELRDHGGDSSAASVEVFRRPGRVLVELRTDDTISRTQAERLATHVAQAVRLYDRWAPKLDVTVQQTAPEHPEVLVTR